MVEKAMPGRLQNVYCATPGGGKYMAVLQVKKIMPSDEGRQRQMALLAFSAFSELKHVFLVDEDVDPFDVKDVLWAMNTRFQGDVDIVTIPGVRCHPPRSVKRPIMFAFNSRPWHCLQSHFRLHGAVQPERAASSAASSRKWILSTGCLF